MYLFWSYLTDCYDIPRDVKQYLAIHFYLPFAQAKNERIKIDEVYNMFFKHNSLIMKAGVGDNYVSNVLSLLNDSSLILDTRIKDNDRIEKFVRMLGPLRRIKSLHTDRAIYVLKKGLLMDISEAFDLFFYFGVLNTSCDETKPFLHRIAKTLSLATPDAWPDGITHNLVRKFIYAGLEIGVSDDCLLALFNVSNKYGTDMYRYLKEDKYITEVQSLNFTLFQQRNATFY